MADGSALATIVPAKLKVTELKDELRKRGQPDTGTKAELRDRLVQTLTHDLTVPQLKEILKTHSLAVSGTKPELLQRLTAHLSGVHPAAAPASAPAAPQSPAKTSKVKKELPAFALTDTFEPLETPITEVKKFLKAAGISPSGRAIDIRKAFTNAVLQEATVLALKSALKARGKPTTGTKAELVSQLLTVLLKIEEEPEKPQLVDINTATLEELSRIPSFGPKLSEKIIANRPYKDVFQVKDKVPGFGPEKIKTVSHLLTGWIADASSQSTASSLGTSEEDAQRRRAQEVKIGTWNIRNISNKKSDENLEKIAKIASSFDFLAVQEVRDSEVVHRLHAKLGSADWGLAISDWVGTDHHHEKYAFFWRTSISVLTPPELLNDVTDAFVRQPFIGYFKAGNFDFIIATIHVVWGATILGRREEVQKLNDLLVALEKRAGTEKDLIIVGDFNLPPTDMGWQLQGWEPLINPPQKTVVGDSSLYDNIWISTEHTAASEWKKVSGCIEFDKIMYGDTIAGRVSAIREVSDHRPVWALFSSAHDDDANLNVDLKNLTL